MTEIQLYRDTLGQPEVIRESWGLANKISATDFVPKSFRGKPEAVMAALLTGRELGLGPMTALQRIHVIEGRPALDALGMRAVVQSAGHQVTVTESTTDRCTVIARRNGETDETRITWTMADAQKAGLGSKDVWKKYPRQMLQARATAEACRLVGADCIAGMPYSSEELADDAPPEPAKRAPKRNEPPAPAEPPKRVQLPAPPTQAAPAPSWDDSDEPVDAELVDDEPAIPQLIPTGDMATEKQVKMALALCSGAKLDDAGRHDLVFGHSNGRTEHIRELTKQEISALIDDLKQPAPTADGLKPGEEPF